MNTSVRNCFRKISDTGRNNRIKTAAVLIFVNISSCCLLFSDSQDLVVNSGTYPDQVHNGERFQMNFMIENPNNWLCNDYVAEDVKVNLKMVKRSNGYIQVDNVDFADSLPFNSYHAFKFFVKIEGENVNGIYDVSFTVDPDKSQEDANRENNTDRGTVEVTE